MTAKDEKIHCAVAAPSGWIGSRVYARSMSNNNLYLHTPVAVRAVNNYYWNAFSRGVLAKSNNAVFPAH